MQEPALTFFIRLISGSVTLQKFALNNLFPKKAPHIDGRNYLATG